MSKYYKAKHSNKKRQFLKRLEIIFFIIILVILGYCGYELYIGYQNKFAYQELNYINSDMDNNVTNEEKVVNVEKVKNLKSENTDVMRVDTNRKHNN